MQHQAWRPTYHRPRSAFRKLYIEADNTSEFPLETELDFYDTVSTHRHDNSMEDTFSPLGFTSTRAEATFDEGRGRNGHRMLGAGKL